MATAAAAATAGSERSNIRRSKSLLDAEVQQAKQWIRSLTMPPLHHQQQQKSHREEQPKQQQLCEVRSIDASRVEVLEVIGQGSMGKVHRGFYDGQEVAVKLLDCNRSNSSSSSSNEEDEGISDWRRLNMAKELKTWRRLRHPNIVRLIGASPEVMNKRAPSRRCYLVSELMPAGTLRDFLLAKRRRLSLAMVLRLATDIASALRYLHSIGIVHRDVKPSNVLLDANLTAKLADFDSARAEAEAGSEMTGEIGTVGYMAPEVADGSPYDRRADVFSYGVCVLEVASAPNDGSSSSSSSSGVLLLQQCFSRAAVTSSSSSGAAKAKPCSPQLAALLRCCLRRAPEKRPTMADVLRMLHAIQP